MEVPPVQALPPFAVKAAFRGHVSLVADDGLDPHGGGLLVELHRPEEVAMVGHGQGRVLGGNRFHPLKKVRKLCRPVQEGELGVLVQVGEFKAAHRVQSSKRLALLSWSQAPWVY